MTINYVPAYAGMRFYGEVGKHLAFSLERVVRSILAVSAQVDLQYSKVMAGNGVGKKIDQDQVRKVAKLARLELDEHEVEEFSGQLSAILGYVEKMEELDTEGVEPLAHCLPISNVLREDVARESLGTDAALANAPQRDGEFFKVPKILDGGGGA